MNYLIKTSMIRKELNFGSAFFLIIVPFILTSSLLQGHFTLFARGWVWLALGCIVCVSYQSSLLSTSKSVKWLYFYSVFVILNFLTGDAYFKETSSVIMELARLLFCIYMAYLVQNDKNTRFTRYFVVTQFVVIIVTSILSISVDIMFPGIIRQAVTMINAGNSEGTIPFYRMGVCEYAFPHAVPILFPGLILLYKNNKIKLFFRILILSIIVLLLYLVFISGVTAALILSIFCVLASVFIVAGDKKRNITRLVALGICLSPLLSDTVMLEILRATETIIPEENKIQGKIINFEETILHQNADGSIQQRSSLHEMSIESFIKSPIIGINDGAYGGHSAVLDRLATLGLLGFIPYLLFIISMIKFVERKTPDSSKFFLYIAFTGFLIMLTMKNMSNIYVWLYSFALLPALIKLNENLPTFLRRH